jgi:hypothetical protein
VEGRLGLPNPLFPYSNVAMGIRHDEGHEFRLGPGKPGFRLEPEEIQPRVRLGPDWRRRRVVNP